MLRLMRERRRGSIPRPSKPKARAVTTRTPPALDLIVVIVFINVLIGVSVIVVGFFNVDAMIILEIVDFEVVDVFTLSV